MNDRNNENKPMYDGHCAFAISIGKTDVKGENHVLVKDGKTYMFSNAVAKLLFRILPNRVAKADAEWSKNQSK